MDFSCCWSAQSRCAPDPRSCAAVVVLHHDRRNARLGLFRAESLQRALAYLAAMGGFYAGDRTAPSPSAWLTPEVAVALVAGCALSFPLLPRLWARLGIAPVMGPVIPGTHHTSLVWVHPIPSSLLLIGVVLSLLVLVSSTNNPFLYFRF